ncbi:hypothetical protein, partial [Helicobacter pylori]|uniref:hypothetical protein n=1 Tax=Helicobacter pylori TaxID=210 RepID=UPI00117A7594
FANAKTATANAYAFKLRCTFVHASLTLRLLVFACQQTIGTKPLECFVNASLGGFVGVGWPTQDRCAFRC